MTLRALAFLLAIAVVPAASAEGEAMALFGKPVVLRGTLGEAQIQVQLRPKEEFVGGVRGSYFAFGQSQEVLLAGEVDGEQLVMEESVNGVDVTGDWYGVLRDGVLSGEWRSVRDETKPFRLEVLTLPGAGKGETKQIKHQ